MIKYNVTGSKRKKLVQKLSALTGYKTEYMGLPSMAFKVGNYVIGKTGTVEGDLPEDVIKALARSGFKGEADNTPDAVSKAPKGLTISVPMDELTDNTIDNLKNMIESKGPLIKKAFKLSSLPMEWGDDTLSVRWFENKSLSEETTDHIKIFFSAMLNRAKRQKYVIPRPLTTDNPKYNFRVFLNAIGLSGTEYKALRKDLLKNLSGCSAIRHPAVKA